MKGKIRIDGRKNCLSKKGYPIVFYLTKDSKDKPIQTGYYSFKEDWDKVNALPKKTHPDFLNLLNYLEQKKPRLKKLLDKAKYENITFDFAEHYLKGIDNGIFVKDALEYADKNKLKRTYRIALTAFNKMYPDFPYSYITVDIAKEFRDRLLKIPVNGKPRSPNGVNSYFNSLSAIWKKVTKKENPFASTKPKSVRTKSKAMTVDDVIKIRDNNLKVRYPEKVGNVKHYLNYWMLCFYLGGIDLVDLKEMRKSNIVNGRIEFIRNKGGTSVFVSNRIFPEAWEIIEKYNCKNHLVPIYKLDYEAFHGNLSRVYGSIMEKLELSKKPYSKAPRYTFINRAKDLLIDERICIEIVGHSQASTHSIYKDEFAYNVRDEAHRKIIDLTI